MGKLIIFSAPSGAGKTTIVNYLLKRFDFLSFSVSATSRKPRPGERHQTHYYFMTPEAFREAIDKEAFIEWEEVYPDLYYGTLKSELERIFKAGKHVIFDVDVKGGLNIKKMYGHQALAVFVKPPTEKILCERLKSRNTEQPKDLEMRIAKAKKEMSYASLFDKILVNDNLEKAQQEAAEMVWAFIQKDE
jgi:guanylate kinase